MTRVVNLHHEPYDVYIGRPGKGQLGYFGNPHPVSRKPRPDYLPCPICGVHHILGESLAEFLKDFERRVVMDKEYRERLEELRNRTLGCFCRPKEGFIGRLMCHGQIIAGYLDGIPPEQVL